MKLTIQQWRVRGTDKVQSEVATCVGSLARRRQIDEAVVRLEKRPETSPPYRVSAHLLTPGPDLMAEATDHSLEAALRKVDARLHALVDEKERQTQRRSRRKHVGPSVRRPAVLLSR